MNYYLQMQRLNLFLLLLFLLAHIFGLRQRSPVCSYGCDRCLANSTVCAVPCRTGWFNSSGGECQGCPLHCDLCNNAHTCTRCSDQFSVEEDGSCSYDHESDPNLPVMLGLIFGFGIPVSCCLLQCLAAMICQDHYAPPPSPRNSQNGSQFQRYSQFDQPRQRNWVYDTGARFNYYAQCSICLQSGVELSTACQHGFHLECFRDWVMRESSCPNCRNRNVYPVCVYCKRCKSSFESIPFPTSTSYDPSNTVCGRCQG